LCHAIEFLGERREAPRTANAWTGQPPFGRVRHISALGVTPGSVNERQASEFHPKTEKIPPVPESDCSIADIG
jgi:hypothetical protein